MAQPTQNKPDQNEIFRRQIALAILAFYGLTYAVSLAVLRTDPSNTLLINLLDGWRVSLLPIILIIVRYYLPSPPSE